MDPFEVLKIGALEFPNRLIMAPLKTAYGNKNGDVTDRHIAFYARRAEGGIAAIIPEPLCVSQAGKEHPKQLSILTSEHVAGLKKLTDALHEKGTLAIAHLNHAGRAAKPKASGTNPEAPSAVACPSTGVTPDVLTSGRIAEVVDEYAQAAAKAVEAGFDLIELQCGLGYLINQFLSPHTNLRDDEYGLQGENRYRFLKDVLAAIRAEVGDKFPIMARMSAMEQVEGGFELGDAIELAKFLEEHGVNALHVVSGSACDSPPWYFQHMRLPEAKNLEWAGQVRNAVGIPVIAAGRLGDPELIRKALADETLDGIAIGRPLLADPDLPGKMKDNRDGDVIQCGACLQGCLMNMKMGKSLGCIVNPELGREAEKPETAEKPEKIVVIGGGPAGIQAALTATQMGHKVVLFEKNQLGGQSSLAYLPPGKERMRKPLGAIVKMLEKSPTDLRLKEEATLEKITAEKPDRVIIATGAVPIKPTVPGLDQILTGGNILKETGEVGKRVLIIGGGMIGLECAEFLARKDHEVTVVEILEEVGHGFEPITKKLSMKMLATLGVAIHTETEVTRFEGKKAYVNSKGEEKLLGEFDTVAAAIGTRSINNLEALLKDQGFKVKVVGDAREPGQIFSAVNQGYEAVLGI